MRVIRTCGVMGEAVGKAAALCVAERNTPRGVFEQHLPKLIQMLDQPGATRA